MHYCNYHHDMYTCKKDSVDGRGPLRCQWDALVVRIPASGLRVYRGIFPVFVTGLDTYTRLATGLVNGRGSWE